MLTENLKKIIEEFNLKTPNNVGVGYGFKISNGIDTRKESIIFFVPEKKKLSNLFPEEILPNEPITIDNKTYFMDVVEVGEIEVLACNPQCNLWITNPPPNRFKKVLAIVRAGKIANSNNRITLIPTTKGSNDLTLNAFLKISFMILFFVILFGLSAKFIVYFLLVPI